MYEVIINGKFFGAALEGMPRVGREIVAALDGLVGSGDVENLKFTIYTPPKYSHLVSAKNIQVLEVGVNHGLLWEQIDFPLSLGDSYSLNFTSTAPVSKRKGCVVVHDAQFLSTKESFGRKAKMMYSTVTPFVAKRYGTIITVSEFAKAELQRFGVTSRQDISVIPHGVDHMERIEPDYKVLSKFGISNNDFILANSYAHHHKNVQVLFQALSNENAYASKLVLFGSSMKSDYAERGITVPEGVKFLGRVRDEELAALMHSAKIFLFPSTTEGFGLPPLEAMSLGCPTICSRAGAMPEVCGDGALYAEPNSASDWLEKIHLLWSNETLREQMAARALARSRLYSWRSAACEYIKTISKDLSEIHRASDKTAA